MTQTLRILAAASMLAALSLVVKPLVKPLPALSTADPWCYCCSGPVKACVPTCSIGADSCPLTSINDPCNPPNCALV